MLYDTYDTSSPARQGKVEDIRSEATGTLTSAQAEATGGTLHGVGWTRCSHVGGTPVFSQ